MNPDTSPRRRRGTPISDSLGADLHALGTILANQTRGLDSYLQRQAARIEERQANLLAESAEMIALPEPESEHNSNLETLTNEQLKSLCRQRQLRGWSKLRRQGLLDFLYQHSQAIPDQADQRSASGHDSSDTNTSNQGIRPVPVDGQTRVSYPVDACRIERLLLLLLQQVGTDHDVVMAAWHGAEQAVPSEGRPSSGQL